MAERAKPTRKPTLVSGLGLVERLAHSATGESVSDLAQAIGMDIGQTHRLLASLVEAGYVFQEQASSRYRLTPKLVQIAATLVRDTDVVQASRTVMRRLRDSTGETVHVAASPGGTLPVCVARELALEPVAVSSSVGETFPFRDTAIGQAVVQARSPGTSGLPRYTIDAGNHRPGVVAVAAAIVDWIGEVVGAIAVSGPEYRLTPDRVAELGELTADAAAAISLELGHAPPIEETSPA